MTVFMTSIAMEMRKGKTRTQWKRIRRLARLYRIDIDASFTDDGYTNAMAMFMAIRSESPVKCADTKVTMLPDNNPIIDFGVPMKRRSAYESMSLEQKMREALYHERKRSTARRR